MTRASLWQVLYREFIGRYLSKVFCYIGYLIVILDDKKQGFHDKLSDTLVVYEDSLNNEKNPERKSGYRNSMKILKQKISTDSEPAFRKYIPKDAYDISVY